MLFLSFVTKAATFHNPSAKLKNLTEKGPVISGKKLFLPFCGSVVLQFPVNLVNVFPFNIALVGSKASRKAAGNVHKLMNQRSLLVFRSHPVKNLRNDFDCVGWGKVKNALPNLAQSMNSRDGAPCLGAFASDAENELWHNMVEFAFLR
jgi:hypothetical protein